jgi:hypothetical protein
MCKSLRIPEPSQYLVTHFMYEKVKTNKQNKNKQKIKTGSTQLHEYN